MTFQRTTPARQAFACLLALAASLLAPAAVLAAPGPFVQPVEVTSETTEQPFRAYYEAFSRRIVSGGEANYPKVGGKPIYGRVSVAVTVRASGEVEHVEVIQSGSKDLSRHAVDLVKRLQPFGAFSPALRAKAPRLVLVAHLNYAHAPRPRR
jgi:TonB family protein